jgi:thiol-disulfide isomerase/thioredoxin
MTNRSILFFFVFLVNASIYSKVMAQKMEELQVKQLLPAIPIKETINNQPGISNTAAFKGKLLILDFWATFCSPCVAFFPKADSLEKQFNGKVKFLPITTESKETAKNFLDHMSAINHIKPMSVVNDRIFDQLFPHTAIPYYVWITPSGMIKAITGPDELTPRKIQAVLDRKEAYLQSYDGARGLAVDYSRSLFRHYTKLVTGDTSREQYDIPDSTIRSYSIATNWIPNTRNGHFESTNRSFFTYNCSIRMLYQIFYDISYYGRSVQGAFDPDSRHAFEFKDTTLLNKLTVTAAAHLRPGSKEMDEWFRKNSVCFEIVYPKGLTRKERMDLCKQDLDRNFATPMGFETHVEQRLDSNQRELRLIKSDSLLATQGGVSEEHHDRYFYSQRNTSLDHFLGVLNGYFFQKSQISFVNKTGVTVPVDLELNCDLTKLDSINAALQKYGLSLSKEPATIDVLVFSDAITKKS